MWATTNREIAPIQGKFDLTGIVTTMTGSPYLQTGQGRRHEESMQIVSGHAGKPKLHFEVHPSSRVPKEMARIFAWFNETPPCEKQEIRRTIMTSAVAHLNIESIHSFEEGNGRVRRQLSEKALP